MSKSEWTTGKSSREGENDMSSTLVLIPGLLSDERVWQPLEGALPGVEIHRADVTKDDTIEAMAFRALSAFEGYCTVVGHSMGGRVAMEVARQAPQRVAKLVLSNTGDHPVRPGEKENRQARVDQGHADFPAMIEDWLPPMVAASRHNDVGLISNLTEMAHSIGPIVHERQIRALVNRPDASAYLPDLACPILLIAGTEDVWSPVAQHLDMQTRARNATLRVVENGGHFLPVERAGKTTRLIVEWLQIAH